MYSVRGDSMVRSTTREYMEKGYMRVCVLDCRACGGIVASMCSSPRHQY